MAEIMRMPKMPPKLNSLYPPEEGIPDKLRRWVELADEALGSKKNEQRRKRRSAEPKRKKIA